MIYVGENKSVICKGDFHPAELYKGETRIAGFAKTEFSGECGISLENCYNDKLYNTQISGNSVQDGTPTPETPIEIQSVGDLVSEGDHAGKYKIPVTARGKNVYKPTRISAGNIRTPQDSAIIYNSKYGTRISTTDATLGEFVVTQEKVNTEYNAGAYQNGYFCIEVGTQLTPGVKYIFSFDCEILESLLNTDYMSFFPNGGNQNFKEFSVINGRNTVEFSYYTVDGINNYFHIRNGGKSLKISNAMITEQGYNSDYEPYIEPQNFDLYLNSPLMKIGNYAEYIDFKKGVVVRYVVKRILTGKEYWHADVITSGKVLQYNFQTTRSVKGWSKDEVMGISDRLKGITSNYLWNNYYREDGNLRTGIFVQHGNYSEVYFRVCPYSTLPTIEEWKAMLAQWNDDGNPMVVWYVEAPIEEEIELPSLPTFKGTTIYEIDTSIAANISGNYKQMEV